MKVLHFKILYFKIIKDLVIYYEAISKTSNIFYH